MNNILPSTLKYHEKYDLKGSMFKRQANHKERVKSTPTLKDLDFLEEHPGVILVLSSLSYMLSTIQCIALWRYLECTCIMQSVNTVRLASRISGLDPGARFVRQPQENSRAGYQGFGKFPYHGLLPVTGHPQLDSQQAGNSQVKEAQPRNPAIFGTSSSF